MLSLRWSVVIALVLVVIATIRIVPTWTVFNHAIDEPDHLAAGMEYLSTGVLPNPAIPTRPVGGPQPHRLPSFSTTQRRMDL
jgi:hypothetical protein